MGMLSPRPLLRSLRLAASSWFSVPGKRNSPGKFFAGFAGENQRVLSENFPKTQGTGTARVSPAPEETPGVPRKLFAIDGTPLNVWGRMETWLSSRAGQGPVTPVYGHQKGADEDTGRVHAWQSTTGKSCAEIWRSAAYQQPGSFPGGPIDFLPHSACLESVHKYPSHC